jgi:D-inositol-3-phosphate glycosyltransferase
VRTLAILSMHTSPLAQPGSGDGGGMNVYVRELAASLARQGTRCEVYTRADGPERSGRTTTVEPGFRVHHLPAGPAGPVAKEDLPGLVPAWTDAVAEHLAALASASRPVDAIHANYWLSGLAGHALKHRLEVPLVTSFHTLERVKAAGDRMPADPARAGAEQAIVGCSDLLLAPCPVEVDQLADLYDADPERIAVVSPGVERATFSPGDRAQARRAVGLGGDGPVLLWVGRIQPLKGLTVAVAALAALVSGVTGAGDWTRQARLVAVGGPSGAEGEEELAAARALSDRHGLGDRVWITPPRPHHVLSGFYRAADAVVVPSRSESFGLVALEAAACGVPAVATAVGGLTTLVDHGVTGTLVAGSDPLRWAQALTDLLADPARAARMGRAAAERARSYTWPEAARRLRSALDHSGTRELVACR